MSEPPVRSPRRFLTLFYNPISLVGLGVALVATAIGLPLLFFDLFSSTNNPYTGILTYGLLPGSATAGVGLAVFGALWERHQRLRDPSRPPFEWPVLDFNLHTQRIWFVTGVGIALVLLVMMSVTSYRAYHYSDSVEFCGLVCHGVMKPEYNAYQHSPHARVACASCHIGPGAGWFVRSKVNGLYQVYSVLFNKYARPIQTPVHSLRPAQETCEQCHWPAKFFGAQQKTFTHYLTDEKNTPWQIQTLMKVGGGTTASEASYGIHWHMNINNTILYVASDPSRETIPYVKAISKQGRVTEYMSTESPLSPETLAKAVPHRMDCVDCHNRPSHIFLTPEQSIGAAFTRGDLDRSLPYLKREGMRLLSAPYTTEAEALKAIERELPMFYEKTYPELAKQKALAIRQAVITLQTVFTESIFPEMKTDWRAHPDHIGHLNSDGCFRCHDGLHKTAEGKVLTNDCNACHTILAQGTPNPHAPAPLRAQAFQHPVDVGTDVTQMKCSTCHNGTTGL